MKRKLPTLKTEDEVDQFWAGQDFTDYVDEFQPEKGVQLDPKLAKKIRDRAKKKHLIAVRLDDELYSKAQKLAFKKSLGLSSLVRMWINEGLRRALRTT